MQHPTDVTFTIKTELFSTQFAKIKFKIESDWMRNENVFFCDAFMLLDGWYNMQTNKSLRVKKKYTLERFRVQTINVVDQRYKTSPGIFLHRDFISIVITAMKKSFLVMWIRNKSSATYIVNTPNVWQFLWT